MLRMSRDSSPDASAMRARVRTVRRQDKAAKYLPRRWDIQARESAHIRTDGLGEDDASVGLLSVLEDGDDRPSDGETAPVEGRNEARLFARRRAKADLRAPRLEVAERRARADLAISVLAGKPDLQVVGLLRRESQICRAKKHHPVVKAQLLQRRLRVAHQLLERGVRSLRFFEADQLHLVELVLADDPFRVLAVGSCLAAETGREGAVLQWKLRRVEDLVAVVVRHRHFRSGNQVVAGCRLGEGLVELRKLAGAAQCLR